MKYNFDEIINRKNTDALNYDGWRQYIFKADKSARFDFKDDEFVRMWVADMDLRHLRKSLQRFRRGLIKKYSVTQKFTMMSTIIFSTTGARDAMTGI